MRIFDRIDPLNLSRFQWELWLHQLSRTLQHGVGNGRGGPRPRPG
jgi:hypothetical protein